MSHGRSHGRLPPTIRNVELGSLLDTFLVCAVTTIVVIRFQLWVTDYPSLSPGKLHIAHMLWGGLGMMLAIGLLLAFASPRWRLPAAILGGVGFGFFIDELGKFITADNDYFFQPTAAIIYVIFVALFLAARTLRNRRGLTPEEELAGAVDLIKQAAWDGLDARDRERAAALLRRSDPDHPLVGPLHALLERLESRPAREPSRLVRLAELGRRRYLELVAHPGFRRALSAVLVLLALLSLAQMILLLFAAEVAARGGNAEDLVGDFLDEVGRLNAGGALHMAAAVMAGALMVAGAYRLRRSRLEAYRLFERALLVQILIVQFFSLLESQFGALTGILFNLLLFATLRYAIATEERADRELSLRESRPPEPVGRRTDPLTAATGSG